MISNIGGVQIKLITIDVTMWFSRKRRDLRTRTNTCGSLFVPGKHGIRGRVDFHLSHQYFYDSPVSPNIFSAPLPPTPEGKTFFMKTEF